MVPFVTCDANNGYTCSRLQKRVGCKGQAFHLNDGDCTPMSFDLNNASIPERFSIWAGLVPVFFRESRSIIWYPTVASRILCCPVHEFVPIPAHSLLAYTTKRFFFICLVMQPACISWCIIRVAHHKLPQSINAVLKMFQAHTKRASAVRLNSGSAQILLSILLVYDKSINCSSNEVGEQCYSPHNAKRGRPQQNIFLWTYPMAIFEHLAAQQIG